jgi:hypothetical protein
VFSNCGILTITFLIINPFNLFGATQPIFLIMCLGNINCDNPPSHRFNRPGTDPVKYGACYVDSLLKNGILMFGYGI